MDINEFQKRQAPIRPRPLMSETPLSALIWIEVAVCLAFVGLRTWVQYRAMRRFFTNDYFIFLAMICHMCTAACYQAGIPPLYELAHYYRSPDAPSDFMDRTTLFLRIKFTVIFLLWTTLWAVKFSLLFFFWRLFDSVRARGKWFWWVMMTITAATFVVAVALQFTTCEHFENFFKLDKCTATARDRYRNNLVFRFAAGTDIGVDFLILLIPFPLLWKLQVKSREKWVLVATFLLPLIPIVFGIARLIICDPGRGIVDPVKFPVYSMTENSAAIITSCIPSLRLFAKNNKGSSRPSIVSNKVPTRNLHNSQDTEKGLSESTSAIRTHDMTFETSSSSCGSWTRNKSEEDTIGASTDSITITHEFSVVSNDKGCK